MYCCILREDSINILMSETEVKLTLNFKTQVKALKEQCQYILKTDQKFIIYLFIKRPLLWRF